MQVPLLHDRIGVERDREHDALHAWLIDAVLAPPLLLSVRVHCPCYPSFPTLANS